LPGSRSAPLYAAPWSVSRRPVGPDDGFGRPRIEADSRGSEAAARPFHPTRARMSARLLLPVALVLGLLLAVPVGLALLLHNISWTRGTRWAVGLAAVGAVAVGAVAVVAATAGSQAGRSRPTAGRAATPSVRSLSAPAVAVSATPTGAPVTQLEQAGPATASVSPDVAGSPLVALPSPSPGTGSVLATAVAQLATLRVAPRSYAKPYRRTAFGQTWADVDENGCDTRNDVLRRDLAGVTLKPATLGCVVARGNLHDPYSGAVVEFVRGGPVRIEIDHVVSLADAWHTGALSWSAAQRVAFANDPLELLAVSADLNQTKADSDAASWLPPSTARRCTFVARQVAIKAKFRLWLTTAEHDAIARVLRGCATPSTIRTSATPRVTPSPATPPATVRTGVRRGPGAP
jgi:hypothetical protein